MTLINYRTIPILLIAFLSFIFTFSPEIQANRLTQNKGLYSKVELSYEYPDQIVAGETFNFTINIIKESDYQMSGVITCKWIEGFIPQPANIDGFKYSINHNSITISWDNLTTSNLIPLTFRVKTSNNFQGVYPVGINFYDERKFSFTNNIGVYISNNQTTVNHPVKKPGKENSVHVLLEFPDEILFTEEYELFITIYKGKDTGSAKIHVRLPPFSKIESEKYNENIYTTGVGKLHIDLTNMPTSPSFSIKCTITNNTTKKAVYPIRAGVIFASNPEVYFDDYIFVTDQKTTKSNLLNNHKPDDLPLGINNNIDTASMFTGLNNLLEAWTESTTMETVKKKDNIEETVKNQPEQTTTPKTHKTYLPVDKDINSTPPIPKVNHNTYYTVQIAASKTPMPDLKELLRSMQVQDTLYGEFDGEFYRYTVGKFQNQNKALELKQFINKIGFPDAFGVKIEKGERKHFF